MHTVGSFPRRLQERFFRKDRFLSGCYKLVGWERKVAKYKAYFFVWTSPLWPERMPYPFQIPRSGKVGPSIKR